MSAVFRSGVEHEHVVIRLYQPRRRITTSRLRSLVGAWSSSSTSTPIWRRFGTARRSRLASCAGVPGQVRHARIFSLTSWLSSARSSLAEARLPEVDLDRRGWSRRVLAEALLAAGEVVRALAEARRAHALLLQVAATRPGYIADHLAKACRTLARCLARAGAAAEGGEVLVRGIDELAPYFAARPRALHKVMRDLADELRVLGPERLVDVPAEVLAQLEALGKA